MKKIIVFLMLMFIGSITLADGDKSTKSEVIITTTITKEINIDILKPIVPLEATFDEDSLDSINIYSLRPTTPKEATFDDEK